MRLPPSPHHPSLADRTWPAWLSDDDGSDPGDELQRWSSLIGIIAAICGNALIALALNVQRYAHIRLHRKKLQIRERARQAMHTAAAASHSQGTGGRYGAAGSIDGDANGTPNGLSRYRDDDDDDETAARDSSETDPLAQSFRSDYSADEAAKAKLSSSYLRDPYWWLGQVLITVGEMGNFLAYGFAPASIVSPLGVVALVSNCIIAPIFFKEVFRQQDFWGVIVAITGAVTVVLSAQTEETKLGPHEVWDAITTMEFEIYMGVSCALIVLLMWLSPRYGNRTILIDLGLVGLFGMSPVRVRDRDVANASRCLHRLVYQGRVLHALLDSARRIHHPGYLCARIHPALDRHFTGPICQQSAATLRFHPGHPDPICPLYPLRNHRQRRPLPRL
jgi:hypothetical protein